MYIGIDPGKKGAFVVLDGKGNIKEWWVMPTAKVKKGRKYYTVIDLEGVCSLLDRFVKAKRVVLEEIHSIWGTDKGSMFVMGEGYGILQGSMVCKGIDFHYAPPKDWQKGVWTKRDMVYTEKQYSNGKFQVDTKATSLRAFKRVFGDVDVRYGMNEKPSNRRRNLHEGVVDAALIALYAKRKLK